MGGRRAASRPAVALLLSGFFTGFGRQSAAPALPRAVSSGLSFYQRIEVLFDLGDPQHLLDRGLTRLDLVPAVRAQRAHAELDRFLGDGGGRGAVQDQRPQRLVEDQQFVNAHAALVAQLAAALAARAPPEFCRRRLKRHIVRDWGTNLPLFVSF